MDAAWVREIRDACARADFPFFFKQWSGKNNKKAGRELAGRTWDEMPEPKERSAECKNTPPVAVPARR